MIDRRVERLAKLCVQYSVGVRPKEKVAIRGNAAAYPLISEIYKECLLSDAYPCVLPSLELDYIFYKQAKDYQLKFVSPFERHIFENMDVNISLVCDPNPKRLARIDPARIRTVGASRSELTETFHKRVADGNLRWTLLLFR